MKIEFVVVLILIAISGTAIISLTAFNSISPIIEAYAGAALNSEDVAKVMRVRVNISGDMEELVFGSFSRIGFVEGTGSQFLLESLPSEDKKPYYRLIKDSYSSRNSLVKQTYLDVNIDIFSGSYDLIETLSYKKCFVTDYFIHVVDSRGKFRFLEDDDSNIEIREVTKFDCVSFTLILE